MAAPVVGHDFPAGSVIMLQPQPHRQYVHMQLQQPQYMSFQLPQQSGPQLATLPLAQGSMQQQQQQQYVGGVQLMGSPMQQQQQQVTLANVPLSSAYSCSSVGLNLTEQLQRLGLDGNS
jgi:hypothetical protein